jgi:hypothetical protein
MTYEQGPPPPPQGYPQQGQPQPGYPQQGYQLPPGYEIKKKKRFYKRVWFWLLAMFLVFIIIIIAAVSSASKDAVSKEHTVVYTITGDTKKADITYWANDGSNHDSQVSVSNVPLPWTKTVTVKGDFSLFMVSATPPDITKGKLHCELKVDGKVASTGDSQDSIGVNCDGSGYDGK